MARRRRADDDVPRLPRGRGMALSWGQVLRIALVATALVALLVLQKPCASSMSRFVTSFGADAGALRDAGDAAAAPAMLPGVQLHGDMTPAEIEAAVRRAREEAGMVEAAPADAATAPVAPDAGP